MANRRMFSRDVVETDKFLEMPLTTQALYFHLSMEADDDGFISSPRKVQRAVGCSEGDLKLLAACGYIIPLEGGVVVIADWAVNNWIRADRKHDTRFPELLKNLHTENGVYRLTDNCQTYDNQVVDNCQTHDSQVTGNCHTEVRLGKVRLGKDSIINTFAQSSESEESKNTEDGTGIFIILDDGSFYDVQPDKLDKWKKAYPELDVEQELYRMASWCDANPTKRKTRRGVEKFINGWLNRSMNDNSQYGKKGEIKNDEPKREDKPEELHVSSGNEILERLKNEGVL